MNNAHLQSKIPSISNNPFAERILQAERLISEWKEGFIPFVTNRHSFGNYITYLKEGCTENSIYSYFMVTPNVNLIKGESDNFIGIEIHNLRFPFFALLKGLQIDGVRKYLSKKHSQILMKTLLWKRFNILFIRQYRKPGQLSPLEKLKYFYFMKIDSRFSW